MMGQVSPQKKVISNSILDHPFDTLGTYFVFRYMFVIEIRLILLNTLNHLSEGSDGATKH